MQDYYNPKAIYFIQTQQARYLCRTLNYSTPVCNAAVAVMSALIKFGMSSIGEH